MSDKRRDDSAVAVPAAGSEPDQLVDHFFRHEYAQLVATLTRRFGVRHWELVEDVVQSSLQRALSSWALNGIPKNPSGWLHRVAANEAIDRLRRDVRWGSLGEEQWEQGTATPDELTFHDDLIRMVFVCCDPCVPPESQIALALKTLCGFGNHEIARALLTTEASVAKRITRAKQRLRDANVELSHLSESEIIERLPHVQAVIYLLFNEGYSSSIPDKFIREELCEESVRLALVLAEHEVTRGGGSSALMALLLFHSARLDARINENGAILLLKEQDRATWDTRLLKEAFRWFSEATKSDEISRYHAEAWIASEHCRAFRFEDTDWERIAQGYDLLCRIEGSSVHQLNRAIAIGYRDGPQAGMDALDKIDSDTLSKDYYLWHATHADLAKQLGDFGKARQSLDEAFRLAPTRAEKELISRKLDQLPE